MAYKLHINFVPFLFKSKKGVLTAPVAVATPGIVTICLQEGALISVPKKDFGAKFIKDEALKGEATFSPEGELLDVIWQSAPAPVPAAPPSKSGSNIVYRKQR